MNYHVEYDGTVYYDSDVISGARKCACIVADTFDVHPKSSPDAEEVIITGKNRWESVWKCDGCYYTCANDGVYKINPVTGNLSPYSYKKR